MRMLARIGYTLAGMALVAPAAARAGMPIPATGPSSSGMPKARKVAAMKRTTAPEHLCAECQRQKLMAQTGVNIPPPPALPPGEMMPGEVCTKCGAPTAVVLRGNATPAPAPVVTGAGSAVMVTSADAPGRAVVGGDDAPTGYATTGAEPAPIGVVSSRFASAAPATPAGSRDASVMPTSMGSNPIAPNNTNKPHVLQHLFGISDLRRDWADMRERRRDSSSHAMIPYGPQTSTVQDVPASVVYGRR